jgi:uncharacterized protein (DUF427 family)
MKAVWHGKTIAESDNTLRIEGNYYFPPESVNKGYLTPSKRIYVCYWKGLARYYHVGKPSDLDKSAAWYYPNPTRLSRFLVRRDFSNYMAFDYRVKIIK